jgi:hypothetical protein
VNPRIIRVPDDVTPSHLPAWSIHCDGLIYQVNLADDEDAIVQFSGTEPLRYPLKVIGGRNVRIIGMQIELETQAGCDIGDLPNNVIAEHPNANVHPRVPGAIALQVRQSHTSFIEGALIDVAGHEADCIVARNPAGLENSQAHLQRDVVIQNTLCTGVEGLGASDVGDGVHGDLFQNQGEVMRKLVFENVTAESSMEGITLQNWDGFIGAKELIMRRFSYTWDDRYEFDDLYDYQVGLAFSVNAESWTVDDVWLRHIRPDNSGNYGRINGERYGTFDSSDVQKIDGIYDGLPPEGRFALPENIGQYYVSPHGL